ncbi:unnamed protein product [Peronospora belbahrii]|uniref:Myosin motor domain-containing protein n=1 Tax=Peronospora belbahrii TaxID=622444 RepID=A0ABN8CLP5_9STRA|nr:unnamed protein product [Peronospora belbahrii]
MQVYVRYRDTEATYEWVHGRILHHLENSTSRVLVQLHNSEKTIEVDEVQDVRMVNELAAGQKLQDVDNIDVLTHLHEPAFVDYLAQRYSVDKVYCRSGAVLIAVNPFKEIPGLYDLQKFHDEMSSWTSLPPHVFSIAEGAYRSLRRRLQQPGERKKNQTILVSGESGAGKTETTKFIMNYLAEKSREMEMTSSSSERKRSISGSELMSANPILECFGNARTLRNDNSSRFGKFVRMFFEGHELDASLKMVGTSVETYLLEKVRVVHQNDGERNFHVFYELLAGASDDMKKKLHLENMSVVDFHYINGGQCFHRNDGVRDDKQFQLVLLSMNVLGFTDIEQEAIWKILSALLHLGNVLFVSASEDESAEDNETASAPCRLASASPSLLTVEEHLDIVSKIFAVDQKELVLALTTRKISVGGETFYANLSLAQCGDARDAMARSLYAFLFQFLVSKVNFTSPQVQQLTNTAMKDVTANTPCIAVLDIFGFEEFDVNQFEQFCINYANEKLQYQFIQDILLTEQKAHIDEGIKWNAVGYEDNAMCLDMLEQRPNGIFSLLDEECVVPKGSDSGFARKLYQRLQDHSNFSASRSDQAEFTFQVHHYAGNVRYQSEGFCEKNKDQSNAELFSILDKTCDVHLLELFNFFKASESAQLQQSQPKLRRRSSVLSSVGIGSQFKQQLASLLDVVQQTQTHYIRCIKPNDESVSSDFDMTKVSAQLRYGGVLKAVEIMRQSFPVRMSHVDFVKQYHLLMAKPGTKYKSASEWTASDLLAKLKIDQAELGKTRVFLRQQAFDQLEKSREHALAVSATRLQCSWRSRQQRRLYIRQLRVLWSIQVRWKAILEKKRRIARRNQAARILQHTMRVWVQGVKSQRHESALIIQRNCLRWHRVCATSSRAISLPETSFKALRSEENPADTLDYSGRESELTVETQVEDDALSTATASVGTSAYSEDTDFSPMDLVRKAALRGRMTAFSDGSDSDNAMLKQALREVERLRHRAEAAEAALSHFADLAIHADSVSNDVMPIVTSRAASHAGGPFNLSHHDRGALNRSSLRIDRYGNTVLHQAIEEGNLELACALLVNEASGALDMLQQTETQRGFSPLHLAVRSGNFELVSLFFRPEVLPHVDLNVSDREGNSALHLATQLEVKFASRVLELLLCFSADANATNLLRQTPLHLCAMIKRSGSTTCELMEILLRHKADSQKVDFLKRSPLHYCMEKDMLDEAVLLMKHGADMNVPDGEGVRVISDPKATNLLRYLRVTPSWIPDTDITLRGMVAIALIANIMPIITGVFNLRGRFEMQSPDFQILSSNFEKKEKKVVPIFPFEYEKERLTKLKRFEPPKGHGLGHQGAPYNHKKRKENNTMEVTQQLEKDAGFMDKYSRQIGAFGLETMAKLVKLKVLIVGLQGIGIECAKNLILAGPNAITLHDDGITEMKDLGTNFFLTEQDVGSPRASAVFHKLAELNKMVAVALHKGVLTEKMVAKHNVVVFSHTSRQELVRWNHFCRQQSPPIGFIACDIRGAFGYAFTDFGDEFKSFDATGEAPITRIITDITNDKDGVVSILGPDEDGKMHEMPDSDHDGWIEISGVQGMKLKSNPNQSINTMGSRRIKFANKKVFRNGKQTEVFDAYRLSIGDTTEFTPYEGGGVFTQHKKPFTVNFKSLEESLVSPVPAEEFGLMFTDGAKFGRAEQLHVIMWSLMEFEERHGQYPRPHNDVDADEVVAIAKLGIQHLSDFTREGAHQQEVMQLEELDEKLVRQAALYSAVELHPLAAFFGGVIAQEVVKFTGKFTPLKQWLHLDAFEVLPDERPLDAEPIGSRYDHIITAYGLSFQKELGNVRTFLVGCGALGCEYLKNFAMIGIACGEKGLVTVTDNDRIEVSNLNRQFLFREHNVGQPKSVAATAAVRQMNGDLEVKALEHLVAPHTENVFNDEFWTDLDVVTNALDNVKARLYVDSKCVFYKLPLLESGTLGTKCNVQVVIPFKTQSYADGPKDAEGDGIPMCTLRNFPSLIEHCIEWSRAQFEDLFVVPFVEAKKFVDNRAAYLNQVRKATLENPNPKLVSAAIVQELERLRNLRATLQTAKGITFERCVELAFELMTSRFRDRILQLIHNFPEDHLTNSGERFWSGAKRFPQAVEEFDPENPLHLNFIRATANVLAVCYGLQPPPEQKLVSADFKWRDASLYAELGSKYVPPVWKPSNEKIAVTSDQIKRLEQERIKSSNDSDKNELMELMRELKAFNVSGVSFEPADFEKDQDMNFHIDFVYAASNLRAFNYRIGGAPRHKCKMIAGKIIPAIATTTASVTGLAMLEMLKLMQRKELAAFKDSSNSLGLNMYLMQEPATPARAKDEYDVVEMSEVKCKPPGFTKWDSTVIELSSDSTLEDFLAQFKEKTELNCDLLFHSVAEMGNTSAVDKDLRYRSVSGLMLYDRNAYGKALKDLYASQMTKPLRAFVESRYEGLVDCSRKYIELQISCSDDAENVYKVPTVICKFS